MLQAAVSTAMGTVAAPAMPGPAEMRGRASSMAHIQSTFTGRLYMCHARFMTHPGPAADNELASAIALEIRTVFRKVKLHLRGQGKHGDLTPSQISVVLRLEEGGPATVSSLARAEGVRPQSMSAVITPLQQAGLVGGTPDPTDGRQTLMSLTPKCLKWLKQGRAARQDWLARKISEKLSAREQETLRAALRLLTKLTED